MCGNEQDYQAYWPVGYMNTRLPLHPYPKEVKKIGRLITSHRYNRLLLLPSGPGRVQQELVV